MTNKLTDEKRGRLYTAAADRYTKLVASVREKHNINPDSSFNDITGNLLTGIRNYSFLIEGRNSETKARIRKDYLSSVQTLKTYLNLLEHHLDFRNAETKLSLREGNYAFPELRNPSEERMHLEGFNNTINYYVAKSKEKLKPVKEN